MKEEDTVTDITITTTRQGRIVAPATEVAPGEMVRWIWRDELPFTVQMEGTSPMTRVTFSSAGDDVSGVVRGDALPGTYKYTIAVLDAENRRILVDDPRMIVEPTGT